MKKSDIQIKPAFSFGWQSVKKDFWYFVAISAIIILLGQISNIKEGNIILVILGFIVSTWISCGSIWVILHYIRGNKQEIKTLFTQCKYFWRMLGVTALTGIYIILGLIALIIPGIYLALKYQFAPYFVIDKNMGVKDVMKASSEMTKDIKWKLLKFTIVSIGVVILGFLALGVGILVATPVIMLAHMHIYNSLLPKDSEEKLIV